MAGPPDPATTEWVPIWSPMNTGPAGPQGTPGENWFAGAGVPAGSLAGSIVGDWYLDTATGDVYEKTGATTWTLRANIKGPQGTQGIQGIQGPTGSAGTPGEKWFSGSGAPAGSLAGSIVGDWYLDTATGDVYEKTGTTTWTLRANIKGPSGSVGLHHTTHEIGGTDVIVNAAWTNQPNVFTQEQAIGKTAPTVLLKDTSQGTDLKNFRLGNYSQQFSIDTINDANTTILKQTVTIDRSGNTIIGGNGSVSGSGGNIACKNQANTFTVPQTISDAAQPKLNLVMTGGTANARNWLVSVATGICYFQPTNDAGIAGSTALYLDRAGNAFVGAYVYEQGRATPMGQPITVPYSAGNYAGLGGGTWTFPGGNIVYNRYSIVGSTVTYTFILVDSTITGFVNQLSIVNPIAGFGGYAVGYCKIGAAESASVYANAGDGHLYVIRQGVAAFPAATGTIWFTLTFMM